MRILISFAVFALTTLLACHPDALASDAAPLVIYVPYAFTNFVGLPGQPGTADGVGNDARFLNPASIVVDQKGVLYVADRNPTNGMAVIRKVSPDASVTTLASGFSGFIGPSGGDYGSGPALALDGSGTLYIADSGHHCIRKIAASGDVQNIAGRFGESGSNDGPAMEARFYGPSGIAIAPDGTIYVSDSWNLTVRRISPTGVVTTLAGTAGESGFTDGRGSEARFGWIRDGSLSAQGPRGIVVDSSGDLYVVDSVNLILRHITDGRTVTTYAGFPRFPVFGFDGIGQQARFGLGFSGQGIFAMLGPVGLAVDSRNNLYLADTSNHAIRRIAPGAVVRTIAGYKGPGTADGVGSNARFASPEGVAIDQAGNLYVADTRNSRITKGVQAFLELTALSLDQGAYASFKLTGPLSIPVIIEASQDLMAWTAIKTNLPPERAITIELAPGKRGQFLRALYSESID